MIQGHRMSQRAMMLHYTAVSSGMPWWMVSGWRGVPHIRREVTTDDMLGLKRLCTFDFGELKSVEELKAQKIGCFA